MEAPGVEPSGDNQHRAGLRVYALGSIWSRRIWSRLVRSRLIKLGNQWATRADSAQ